MNKNNKNDPIYKLKEKQKIKNKGEKLDINNVPNVQNTSGSINNVTTPEANVAPVTPQTVTLVVQTPQVTPQVVTPSVTPQVVSQPSVAPQVNPQVVNQGTQVQNTGTTVNTNNN